MKTKTLMLEACKEMSPLWKEVERRDRSLADQGRRAMQSMVLQFAEGSYAYQGNRRAKLLGARAEANETRACLELANACDLLSEPSVQPSIDKLDRIAATLWLEVHRPF